MAFDTVILVVVGRKDNVSFVFLLRVSSVSQLLVLSPSPFLRPSPSIYWSRPGAFHTHFS